MKKFYALAASVAVAFTALAQQAPSFTRVEKAPRQIDFSTATITKLESAQKRQVSSNKKNMYKAPADYSTPFEDVAGTYLFTAYEGDSDGEGVVSVFQITEPDADGNCKIQNFLADYYGVETNDLECKLTNKTVGADEATGAEGYVFTYLTIPGMSTLFSTTQNGDYIMFLYGPYGKGGATGIFSNDIEFIVFGDMLEGAYTNQGVWVGYKSTNGYRGMPFVGAGGEDGYGVSAVKPNSTFTAKIPYQESEESEVVYYDYSFPVLAEYYEQYGAILTLGFGGSGEYIAWYIEPEDGLAQAVDAFAGNAYVRDQNTGEYTAYPYYVYTSATDEHILADANVATVGEKTVLSADLMYFLCELGAYEIFTDLRLEMPFTIEGVPAGEGDSGIENVAVDNSNAPVEFYNLQGMKIQNPSNGVYIRRQGTSTSKVLVK